MGDGGEVFVGSDVAKTLNAVELLSTSQSPCMEVWQESRILGSWSQV